MQANQTDLSPHVKRLIEENYTVHIVDDFIIVDNVPYLSSPGVISKASIISSYNYKNGTETFGDHTVWFTGTPPCDQHGNSLHNAMIASIGKMNVANRDVNCHFSYKSERPEVLQNIYNKLMHYIRKLYSYSSTVDPSVTAALSGSISFKIEPSVFHYPNTAISRAGLDAYEKKLKLRKIAIIGLGGTGSYILDALAKTPVENIHLYDDDTIDSATGFRMPGALTIEETNKNLFKTDYLAEVYSRLRIGIKSFPVRVNQNNLQELDDCDFVFIAIDHGPSRGLISDYLSQKNIPFIDVGIGVERLVEESKLFGRVRVTYVDKNSLDELSRLPSVDDQAEAVYNNIQLAELNALNGMLAVILYKQKIGFYSLDEVVNSFKYVIAWQQIISHENKKP